MPDIHIDSSRYSREMIKEIQKNNEAQETFTHRFKFPERQAVATVISCHHLKHLEGYMLDQVRKLAPTPSTTLFVEQSSTPQSPDSLQSQLKAIAQLDPIVAEDFKKRAVVRSWSIFDKKFWNQTYGLVADTWINMGGTVVNMDSASNISPDAIQFMTQEAGTEFAIELVYSILTGACADLPKSAPQILKHIFPSVPREFLAKQCEYLYDSLVVNQKHVSGVGIKTDRQRDQIREKYMRHVLEDQLKDGDVVLANPNHIKAIIAQDR